MNQDLAQIKQVLPEVAKDEEVKEVSESLQNAKAFLSVSHTHEGKLVIEEIKLNALSILGTLQAEYLSLPEAKLRSLIAAYNENMTLLERFMNASDEVNMTQNDLNNLVIQKQTD